MQTPRPASHGSGTPPPGGGDGAGVGHAEGGPGSLPHYSCSPSLPGWLARENLCLAVTSYQSGLIYLIGVAPDGALQVHQTALPRPMGLRAIEGTPSPGFVVAGEFQIIRFRNVLAAGERADRLFDACYVPRRVDVTGRLDAHDVGLSEDGEPVFVCTRFNCVARVDPVHSFAPVWRPDFVSALVDEDRCHLNGMAVEGGRVRFATAVSRSDTVDGWRDRRTDGGVVIDVASGRIVCEGLSMPHSPRLHEGRLWVLNSGTGEIGEIVMNGGSTGRFSPLAFCPGFVRGLGFVGHYACVGLSKPRHGRFAGLALDTRLQATDSEPWCGVQIIDLATGACAAWFRIDGAVEELYDVECLPGIGCAMAVAPGSAQAANVVTVAAAGGRVPPKVPAMADAIYSPFVTTRRF